MESKIVRVFASLGGSCPFQCLHCYTYNANYTKLPVKSIDKIVDDLSNQTFNIVYISGHRESFYNVDEGLLLVESLFNRYKCDILFTTRNIFNDSQLKRLSFINRLMKSHGKDLFVCVSIPAIESYTKIENKSYVPHPHERIKFIEKVFSEGIFTFLTLRPLFPKEFIPIDEVSRIIHECAQISSLVISSGIVVDNAILGRLKDFPKDFKYHSAQLMPCLENNYDVKYVNVDNELSILKNVCDAYKLPFFTKSIPAIEFIKKRKDEVL